MPKREPLFQGQLDLLCLRRRKNGVTWYEPLWIGGKYSGELMLGKILQIKTERDEVVRKVHVTICGTQKEEALEEPKEDGNEPQKN